MTELNKMLIDREYDENLIDNAIRRALRIFRHKAFESKVRPVSNTRPVFVSTVDPRLTDIGFQGCRPTSFYQSLSSIIGDKQGTSSAAEGLDRLESSSFLS